MPVLAVNHFAGEDHKPIFRSSIFLFGFTAFIRLFYFSADLYQNVALQAD